MKVRAAFHQLFAVFLGLVCLFPLCFLVLQSLARRWDYPAVWPAEFSGAAWRAVLQTNALVSSLLISLGTAVSVGAVATAAGFLTSRYIAYHSRRRPLLFLAYVPFVMSPVILGTCLLFLFIKLGLADHFSGLIAAQGIIAYGFAVVFFVRFWNVQLRAMQDLVYTLGGGTWTAFRRVLIPLARGPLFVCFCQTFLISWFDYGLALIIGGGKVQTLTVRLFAFITEANMPLAAVSGLLLILPPVALFWLNRRFLLKPV